MKLRHRMRALAAALLLGLALGPGAAVAGHSCEQRPQTAESVTKALGAAARLKAELDASGSEVALVGRSGQDLRQYGLKYSHLGIATRSGPGGAWRVRELLNTCGAAVSDLFSDGLADFFLDDPFAYGFIAMHPPPELGARLAARLSEPGFARSMHEPKYSVAAYPFSTKYQNSNQWALEVLAAAESGRAMSRSQAQAWLKEAGYAPSEMRVGPLERLGGRMFRANVAFDDHPNALRFSDRIQTVTVDSIERFLLSRPEPWRATESPDPP